MFASALLALAVANVARAQSTASLFPVGFQGDDLQGTVVGTGPQGTTYVLSATFGELGIPYTLTLVQGPTYLSEGANIVTAGVTVPIDAVCGISGNQAVCTEVVGTGIDATTITESGELFLTAVPIGGGAGGGATTRTAANPSVTFSNTGSAGTELPPSLSLPGTASIASPTAASGGNNNGNGSIGVPGASGAMKNSFIGLGLLLPVLSVLLNGF